MIAPYLLVVILVISLALGSVPNGVIIGKVFYHTDIREVGSGNIGTTNAMRALGKKGGAAVFVLDFGKGVLSGFIALWIATAALNGAPAPIGFVTIGDCLAVSFIGCVVGHIFTPWLKFHGGKGIAVAVGCLFVVLGPVPALLELALFIVLVVVTKYVSVGSIAAAAACPFVSLYCCFGDWFAWALMSIAGLLIVWAHRENIKRLLAGNESKIGGKKDKEGSKA